MSTIQDNPERWQAFLALPTTKFPQDPLEVALWPPDDVEDAIRELGQFEDDFRTLDSYTEVCDLNIYPEWRASSYCIKDRLKLLVPYCPHPDDEVVKHPWVKPGALHAKSWREVSCGLCLKIIDYEEQGDE